MSRKPRRERRERTTTPLIDIPFQLVQNPLPPTAWATSAQVEKIHQAAMHILENIGISFYDDEVLDIWQNAGAKVDRSRRHVWLDRGLVLENVAKAPSHFTWQARNPAHNLIIGGNYLNFVPNSGMPYVSDLKGGRRTGTLEDVANFTKLAQMSGVLHFGGGTHCEPQDIRASVRHLHRMTTYAHYTDKAIRDVPHGRIITADNIEMARIMFGGELPPNPVFGGVINVNSPLIYDDRMVAGLVTLAKSGQIPIITPFIMAGAMSPISIASALAQQTAEALAGIALTQIIHPGCPVIFGGFTMNVDMKSGSPAFGSPEGAWATIVGGQMARRYGLPYRSSGSLTNSQTPDAQAIYDTQWSMWPAMLAHANFIHHAVGWMEGGLVASYEKFIIDMENLGMFAHFMRGFSMDDDAFALDMIEQVGPGGHHFGTSHTQAGYETAFYQPFLTDRQNFESWQAAGAEDAPQRAHKIWREMLKQYEAPPLDVAIQDELADFVARRERELAGVDLYA